MLHRFSAFVGGITECYKYIQRIKAAEMTEFGLKGTHVMCLYYLRQNPTGLTARRASQHLWKSSRQWWKRRVL